MNGPTPIGGLSARLAAAAITQQESSEEGQLTNPILFAVLAHLDAQSVQQLRY